jgi:hypothetical protein
LITQKLVNKNKENKMKRSSAVASVCLAVAMLSSCDTNKDVDGGISSVTYTTSNTVAPIGVGANDSGIVLSNITRSSVTWSCPPGYVVPTKLLNSLPSDGAPTEMDYEGTKITGKILSIDYEKEDEKWMVDFAGTSPIADGDYFGFYNEKDDQIDMFCTESGTQDNWS